jgi:predicted dehydrogenase
MSEEQVLLRQLEGAILHRQPPEVSGRDNLKTMAVIEACVRSSEQQRWINPQELLNESQQRRAVVGNRD